MRFCSNVVSLQINRLSLNYSTFFNLLDSLQITSLPSNDQTLFILFDCLETIIISSSDAFSLLDSSNYQKPSTCLDSLQVIRFSPDYQSQYGLASNCQTLCFYFLSEKSVFRPVEMSRFSDVRTDVSEQCPRNVREWSGTIPDPQSTVSDPVSRKTA